jgi:hypothetical protein
MLFSLLTCVGALAAEPYLRPSPGNQYAAKTAKYLYVIWAVPNDLSTFKATKSREELEALMARTAVFLCKQHLAVDPNPATPCKLQVVRMTTNDEYTKSAAGGFKTVATLVLPKERASADVLDRSLTQALPELRALFTRFEVQHERLGLH